MLMANHFSKDFFLKTCTAITCAISTNKPADILISFHSMYQSAIHSQYSDHKFGFLSDFSCVHELWFMFKFFSLLDQIICLQGK